MDDSIERTFDRRNGRFDVAFRVVADGRAPADLWRLLATPAAWPDWSPHIRRASPASGAPTVTVGDTLRIDGWGPLHVTTTITHVDPGSRWDFRVDLPAGHRLMATHEVLTAPSAVQVRMALRGPAPRPLTMALLHAYRPMALLALHRLVMLAKDERRTRRPEAGDHVRSSG